MLGLGDLCRMCGGGECTGGAGWRRGCRCSRFAGGISVLIGLGTFIVLPPFSKHNTKLTAYPKYDPAFTITPSSLT